MIRNIKELPSPDFRGGLVTIPNVFSLQPNQTPNAINVKFNVGGDMEKRLGSTTINATVLVTSAATGFSPDSSGTLSTGLQAYWKMDEQSGTRVDSFGSNNLTDVFGNIGFRAGIIGNAASFAAINTGNLSAADVVAIQGGTGTSYSLSAWVNLVNTADQTIIRKGVLNVNHAPEYDFNVNGGRFRFLVANSTATGTVVANSIGAPSTSTWYHLVGVHDSANGLLTFSVNLSVNSASYTGGGWNSGVPLLFGGSGGGSSEAGTVLIDEVGFWKKVLTSQERIDLYNSGNGNSYSPGRSASGWASFDFGAGFAGGVALRHLVVAAGTGIYASSNRGLTFVVVATDRGTAYQSFTRSKSWLIATSDTMNRPLIWPGSVGTFMVNNTAMPPSKYALDFAGFLLLMNDSSGRRRIVYGPNATLNTDPFDDEFEIPSSLDDEITGGIVYNGKAYVPTRYKMFRVSHVGGNPDFAVKEVANFGAVPHTMEVVTIPQLGGEVIVCLGFDKKLRIFDGTEYRVVSDNVEFNNGQSQFAMQDIQTSAIQKSHSEYDTQEELYKLWVAIQPSTETTHCINLNLRTLGMFAYDNQGFNTAVMAESGNFRHLFGVKRGGDVHWMDTSNTDNGAAINSFYDSPPLFARNPGTVSKSQKIDFYLGVTSSGSLHYQDRNEFKSAYATREVFSFPDTSGVTQLRKSINIPSTQNVYQYRITDSSSTASSWKIRRTHYAATELGVGKGQ